MMLDDADDVVNDAARMTSGSGQPHYGAPEWAGRPWQGNEVFSSKPGLSFKDKIQKKAKEQIPEPAKATEGAVTDVAGKKAPHGNKADDRPATLYEKYGKDGDFQKHGITKHDVPSRRYSKKEIDGGTVKAIERGPRREMLKKERNLVETNPGPHNRERWAGSRKAKEDTQNEEGSVENE